MNGLGERRVFKASILFFLFQSSALPYCQLILFKYVQSWGEMFLMA